MSSPPIVISSGHDIRHAVVEMLGRRIGCLPVVTAGALVGLVSEVDVVAAAMRTEQQARRRSGEPAERVSAHMTSPPCTLGTVQTLRDAIELCRADGLHHIPIIEHNELVGIVSDRDLRRALGQDRSLETTLDELMTRNPTTIDAEASLAHAAEALIQRRISCLPVTGGGTLVGILTVTDLLDHALHQLRNGTCAT